MNKKALNAVVGIFLLVTLLVYTGAEETLNNSENKTFIEEENLLDQNVSMENLYNDETILEENQSLEETGDSNISTNKTVDFIEASNITNYTGLDNFTTQEGNEEINSTNETLEQDYFYSGSSSSGSDSNDESQYIDSLELELNNEISGNMNETNLQENNSLEPTNEDICLIQDLGEKVIEIQNCEKGDLERLRSIEVTIQKFEKSEFEKEVIFSSLEDFEKSFVFYLPLTKEVKKEEIKIYWENEENLEITKLEEFSVEYYDENGNGLIDKVSWIVPHLSEQIFNIVIEIEQIPQSEEQLFLNVSAPSEQTTNPLIFNFDVNYSGNFSCKLIINGTEYDNLDSDQDYSLNLPNGTYLWEAYCFNISNTSIIDGKSGNFTVNEGFYSSLEEGKLYFLDLVENKIKNPETIIINSTKPSNFTIRLIKDNQVIYTRNSYNSTTLIMNENLLNSSGIYRLSVEFDEPSPKYSILTNFSVASANLSFNNTQIEEGQSVKITVNVNSPLKEIVPIYMEYGDGDSNFYPTPTHLFNQDFTKKYLDEGKYTIILSTTIEGAGIFTIQKNGITVTNVPSGIDDDAPSISLLNPDDEKIIQDSIVNFSYKASDNVKIQNCTFKLYENCASMNYCSTSDSNLVFPLNSQQKLLANNFSVQNNKEVEINLKDFEDGIYEWIVECYDNSSNYDWEISFFEIRVNETSLTATQNYDQKEEIELLKEQADEFIITSFNLDEKEVLDDLNILNDTKYYKKRLLDIENFFKENYKYVSSPTLRETKTNEYLEELESIKNKIPKSITIQESHEYIKNSIDVDFEEIVEEYFESTNTQISRSSVKKLANVNKDLQNELSVSVKAKNVDIEYNNGTQKITLIKKEVTLNDELHGNLLEFIPKELYEDAEGINFLSKNKIVEEDSLFEIKYEDLENEEIVYYFLSPVKLKDIEATETLLFEDDLNKFDAGLTGFFVLEFITEDFTLYAIVAFILLLALLFIIPFVIKKFRIIGWKREPNVVKVFNLIEEINKLLKEKEIEKAREKYYKIKEIYPVLPKKTKAYFYQRIKEMLIRIDRKDIFNLVKEYQEAKRKWNKEDVMRLYEDIKKIYERLPEKDRKKVYDIINGY